LEVGLWAIVVGTAVQLYGAFTHVVEYEFGPCSVGKLCAGHVLSTRVVCQ
jgi:hypothetical protein